MSPIAQKSIVRSTALLVLRRRLFAGCAAVLLACGLTLGIRHAAADSVTDTSSSFDAEAQQLVKKSNELFRELASVLGAVQDDASAKKSQNTLRTLTSRLDTLLSVIRDAFSTMQPEQAQALRRKLFDTRHKEFQVSVTAVDKEVARILEMPTTWAIVNNCMPKLFTPAQRSTAERHLKLAGITDTVAAADFKDKARIAFMQSRRSEALNYVRADYIYSPNPPAKELLQWCKGLKSPALVLHWGAGLEVAKSAAPVNVNPKKRSGGGLLDKEFEEEEEQVEAPIRNDQGWIESDIRRVAGDIGAVAIKALQNRAGKGMFGAWGKAADSGKYSSDKRGVTMLARGNRQELLSAAREQQLDLVLAMSVEQHKNTTTMTFRVLNPALDKPIWESRPIYSNSVNDAIRKGRENPAKPVLESLLAYIDKDLALAPMPDLTPDQVAKRAKTLAENRPANVLKPLCELRYYQRAKLLTDEQANEAYEQLVGEGKGKLLSTGTDADRQRILSELLPRSNSN